MRIKKICDKITKCDIFCDIGCDHGYITKFALDNNLCNRAVIADISQKSLDKAVKLLYKYILDNRVSAYVTDGFLNIDKRADLAVIAGIGGDEIIKILQAAPYFPNKLILQPMKNAQKLREFVQKHCFIKEDELFFAGKHYYEIMVLEKGKDKLNSLQLKFGKTNLQKRSDDFLRFLKIQIKNTKGYLKHTDDDNLKQKLKELLRVYGDKL